MGVAAYYVNMFIDNTTGSEALTEEGVDLVIQKTSKRLDEMYSQIGNS